MHHAANFAFTLATLFTYQALNQAEKAFLFDEDSQQIEKVEDAHANNDASFTVSAGK